MFIAEPHIHAKHQGWSKKSFIFELEMFIYYCWLTVYESIDVCTLLKFSLYAEFVKPVAHAKRCDYYRLVLNKKKTFP